jgi:hypothetical protein
VEFALLGFGLIVFYTLIVPILLFTARGRVTRLESELAAHKEEVSSLRDRLERLSEGRAGPATGSVTGFGPDAGFRHGAGFRPGTGFGHGAGFGVARVGPARARGHPAARCSARTAS